MADTLTLLLAVSTSLLTAVMVTVPVLVVAEAAMVSTLLELRRKSRAAAGLTGVAATVMVVLWLEVSLRVAVTLLVPPFSLMLVGVSFRVTPGGASVVMDGDVYTRYGAARA